MSQCAAHGSLKIQDAKITGKIALWAPSHKLLGLYLHNQGMQATDYDCGWSHRLCVRDPQHLHVYFVHELSETTELAATRDVC